MKKKMIKRVKMKIKRIKRVKMKIKRIKIIKVIKPKKAQIQKQTTIIIKI